MKQIETLLNSGLELRVKENTFARQFQIQISKFDTIVCLDV